MPLNKKNWIWCLILGLGLTLAGCSGTSKEEDEYFSDDAFGEELSGDTAQTDELPQETVETPEEPMASEEAPSESASFTPSEPIGDGNFTTYTAQKGDTLMKISFDHYGTVYRWKRIYELNQETIGDYKLLIPGTVLRLESVAGNGPHQKDGESYLIQQGDTLGSISYSVYGEYRYWKHLYDYNKDLIRDPNQIYAGFLIYYLPKEQLNPEDYPPVMRRQQKELAEDQEEPFRDTASVPESTEEPLTQTEEVSDLKADDWFSKGEKEYEAGNFEGALTSYRQSREQDPEKIRTWFKEIKTLRKLERDAEAKELALVLTKKQPQLKSLPMFKSLLNDETVSQ